MKKKNLLKRQYIVIAVAVVLIAVGAVLYGVFDTTEQASEDLPELLDGEVMLENSDRYFMFSPLEQSEIQSIVVHNENGEYAFDYDEENDTFFIRDYYATPYNAELFNSLENVARYPMVNKRISESASDFESYGLADSQNPAWYVITSKKGVSNKVYVGDMIQTGGGYYCRVDGRDAVYIIDNNTNDPGIIFNSVKTFVTPILSYPITSNKYFYVDNFTLQVDGKILFSLRYMTDEEREAEASVDVFKMLVPEGYTASTDNLSAVLEKFCDFEGVQTLEFAPMSGDIIDDATLEKYNLKTPKYYLYYNIDNVNSFVRISEQNEDGTYYAYSELFNIIALVDPSTVDFLEWDFSNYVSSRIFQRNINIIESIRVEADGVDETFSVTGENGTLKVTLDSHGGRELTDEELDNFRNLYYKMQALNFEGYAESTATDDLTLRLTVKTRVGSEYVYEFYNYSSRRAYFTINGKGEFFVLSDKLEMIIADTQRVVNSEMVDHVDKG